MDRNDQQAIEGLFQRLSRTEQEAPARDADAEAFIAQRIAAQPGAPYFMAQTIVVQQAALEQAQARIEQLEAQPAGGGGFLSSLFGGGAARPGAAYQPRQTGPATAALRERQGGGFLAGAAQTAMGVAGGVLLGNALAGMFAGEAEAAEGAAPEEAPATEDAMGGMDDFEM